jgi:hypothetical protein
VGNPACSRGFDPTLNKQLLAKYVTTLGRAMFGALDQSAGRRKVADAPAQSQALTSSVRGAVHMAQGLGRGATLDKYLLCVSM